MNMKRYISNFIVLIVVFSAVLFLNVDSSDFAKTAPTSRSNDITLKKSVSPTKVSSYASLSNIPGTSTKKGHENEIEILEFSHGIVSPRDAASGMPTGKRQHKPFTLIKPIDKASPLIAKAFINNNSIEEVKLTLYDESKKRASKHTPMMTITLRNATVTEINHSDIKSDDKVPTEKISLTYQNIVWEWVDTGVTAEDDWNTPIV
jgi:type VI secretion system secreted protein Hcp